MAPQLWAYSVRETMEILKFLSTASHDQRGTLEWLYQECHLDVPWIWNVHLVTVTDSFNPETNRLWGRLSECLLLFIPWSEYGKRFFLTFKGILKPAKD